MEIQKHIIQFLKKNKNLIIPKIGAFTVEKVKAKTDYTTNTIIPPSEKIFFDHTIHYLDEALVDFIADALFISNRDAEEKLEEYAKSLKERIDKGETINIESIGDLIYNSTTKRIAYSQTQQTSVTAKDFGLSPVRAKKIEAKKPTVVKQPIKTNKKTPWTIYAGAGSVILIAALIVVLSIYTDILGSAGKKVARIFQAEEQNEATLVSELSKDTIPLDPKKDSLNKILDQATDKREALLYEEPPNLPKYTTFIIIAGSFSNYDNAEILSNELKAEGYDSQILRHKEQYRVTLKSYTDEDLAIDELYKFREIEKYSSVWLLKGV